MKGSSDMSFQAIEERLVAVSRLSTLSLRQPPRISMSASDVEARLLEWAEMSQLCAELAESKIPEGGDDLGRP